MPIWLCQLLHQERQSARLKQAEVVATFEARSVQQVYALVGGQALWHLRQEDGGKGPVIADVQQLPGSALHPATEYGSRQLSIGSAATSKQAVQVIIVCLDKDTGIVER